MKNKTAILAALALTVLPTAVDAELQLDISGYTRLYALSVHQDSVPPGTNTFEFRRDTELYIGGQTELEGGLTAGFYNELKAGSNLAGDTGMNELHFYFMNDWGRVNLGQEDGAAYLLQVPAPSADDNIDGHRAQISGLNQFALSGTIDYDHANFTRAERITYLSPKLNGFQAGVSYAPSATTTGRTINGMTTDTQEGFEDIAEAGLRWDGEWSAIKFNIGSGYSIADETTGLTADHKTWNTGLRLAYEEVSAGLVYMTTNAARLNGFDIDTWVGGIGWDRGPYHMGVSYLVKDDEDPAFDTATRLTMGGGYRFAEGMTLRATVAHGDDQVLAQNDFMQIAVGTEIEF